MIPLALGSMFLLYSYWLHQDGQPLPIVILVAAALSIGGVTLVTLIHIALLSATI